MNNIETIVENGFCTGCCDCISSCSDNNITFMMSKKFGHPVPVIDSSCVNCGDCLKACKSADLICTTTVS